MSPVVLFIPCRLVTINGERRANRWERARTTADARLLGQLAARNARLAPMQRVNITAQPSTARRPGPLADAGAHMPTIKALIDGLVDAGVLPDDGPAHLASLTLAAPIHGERDAITLILEELQ